MSGDKDPVGKNGKGVLRLRDRYINLGIKDASCKLYEGRRHEMLNEINKDKVIENIIFWINEKNELKEGVGEFMKKKIHLHPLKLYAFY